MRVELKPEACLSLSLPPASGNCFPIYITSILKRNRKKKKKNEKERKERKERRNTFLKRSLTRKLHTLWFGMHLRCSAFIKFVLGKSTVCCERPWFYLRHKMFHRQTTRALHTVIKGFRFCGKMSPAQQHCG